MAVLFEDVFDDSEPLRLLSRVRTAYDGIERPLILDLALLVRDLIHERDGYQSEIRDLKRRLDDAPAEEPAAKKRKLLGGAVDALGAGNAVQRAASWQRYPVAFQVHEISFALPLRKKLTLQFLEGPSAGEGGICIKTPSGGDEDIFLCWNDMDEVICVPVPEKAQPASQFIIIPKPSSSHHLPTIMWTAPNTPLKNPKETIMILKPSSSPDLATATATATTPLDTLIRLALDAHLTPTTHPPRKTILPSPTEFTSALVQAHRKAETAHHVKAHRGSKEGFLYFLPTGILFAPRTPILYFPFRDVTSISYSSVLLRTFNLNVCVRGKDEPDADADGAETEYEFAMLDQADFAGIDAYIKRHGLNDKSLAAHRRAKVYNVNPGSESSSNSNSNPADAVSAVSGVNGSMTAAATTANGEGEESELARAERAIQDAEDEEEEDYDPSGGESEGSGSDSEEEDEVVIMDRNDEEEEDGAGSEGGGDVGFDEWDDDVEGEEEEDLR